MIKDVKDMSLLEAKEYLTEKLEAIYQEEKRVAADLKVITLMLHKEKED
jgi:hypothetical protein